MSTYDQAIEGIAGAKLDYAVAVALDCTFRKNSIGAIHAYYRGEYIGGFNTKTPIGSAMPNSFYRPSRNPEQGQQIIEKYKISTQWMGAEWVATIWSHEGFGVVYHACGMTALSAAMRALVVKELGGVELIDNREIEA